MNIEKFMYLWNTMQVAKDNVAVALKPAVKAIEEHFRLSYYGYMTWGEPELHGNNIVFTGEFTSTQSGIDDPNSYILPLAVALEGKEAIFAYFEAENLKAQEAARLAGIQREVRAKESRFQAYLELKNEFEPLKATEVVARDK